MQESAHNDSGVDLAKHHSAVPQPIAFPPVPVELDWDHIGVRAREVNGHIECKWSAATQKWSELEFVKSPFIQVEGLSPAINYGQQAYEGMKAYRQPSGAITVFRLPTHASRLSHSASFVSLPSIPPALFTRAVSLVVALNAAYVPPHGSPAALYIRPLVFGTSAQLNLLPAEEVTFAVFVSPINALHGHAPVAALILEEFDRAAPRGTGSAKVGGNYAPMFKHAAAAKSQGYGITLHLDSQTRTEIDEFSTSGFIGATRHPTRGYTLTVASSGSAIASITSDSCVEIAQKLGWAVERRRIRHTELDAFDEVLAVGTASTILPIGSITMESVGRKVVYSSEYGAESCFGVLLAELQGVQCGTREDVFGWNTVVQWPEKYL